MKARLVVGLLAGAVATLPTACGGGGGFDPSGEDVSLTAAWQIRIGPGGPLEPLAWVCGNARIDRVRVELYEDADELDPERVFTTAELEADCTTASIATGPILEHGVYRVQLVGLDRDGAEIDRSDAVTFDVDEATDGDAGTSIFEPADVFYPLGDAVSLSGMWEIDLGMGPASANATSCEGADATHVQLELLDIQGLDALPRSYFTDELVYECFQAQFDTRPMAVLAEEAIHGRWVGLDEEGTAVGESVAVLIAPDAGHAELETVAIEVDSGEFDPRGNSATLEGSWLLNGAEASEAACSNMGIANVQLLFKSGEGDSYSGPQFTWPCTDGGVDTRPMPVLANGRYLVEWLALSSTGVEVEHLMPLPLEVSGGHVLVPEANFGVERGAVSVQLKWQQSDGDTVGTSCAEAGVETMEWTFLGADEQVVYAESGDCFDELPATQLPFGEYTLEITGAGASDAWAVSCAGIVVDAATVMDECFVELSS